MITLAPALGAVTARLSKRLTGLLAAGAVAFVGLAGTATPARSNDEVLRFILGAAAIAIIIRAIDENRPPPTNLGRNVLPDACLETISIRGRHLDVYNGRCLERAGLRNLPRHCEAPVRTSHGHRRSYTPQCLYDAGYRPQSGWGRPTPHPAPGWDRPHPGQPWQTMTLPRHCEMHYRVSGRRVAGYDGWCLTNAGLRNLPRHCRVTATDGRHYFNADCLISAGYRRARR